MRRGEKFRKEMFTNIFSLSAATARSQSFVEFYFFCRFPAVVARRYSQCFSACLLQPNMNMTDNKILTERCHRI